MVSNRDLDRILAEEYLGYYMTINLSQAGKEELAMAILLWKDWKSNGVIDINVSIQAAKFAEMLDVAKEFKDLLVQIPPMKVIPR